MAQFVGIPLPHPLKKIVEHIFSSNVSFLLHNVSYVEDNVSYVYLACSKAVFDIIMMLRSPHRPLRSKKNHKHLKNMSKYGFFALTSLIDLCKEKIQLYTRLIKRDRFPSSLLDFSLINIKNNIQLEISNIIFNVY